MVFFCTSFFNGRKMVMFEINIFNIQHNINSQKIRLLIVFFKVNCFVLERTQRQVFRYWTLKMILLMSLTPTGLGSFKFQNVWFIVNLTAGEINHETIKLMIQCNSHFFLFFPHICTFRSSRRCEDQSAVRSDWGWKLCANVAMQRHIQLNADLQLVENNGWKEWIHPGGQQARVAPSPSLWQRHVPVLGH